MAVILVSLLSNVFVHKANTMQYDIRKNIPVAGDIQGVCEFAPTDCRSNFLKSETGNVTCFNFH
jgi:hypothetical protein